jgi:PhnB protein
MTQPTDVDSYLYFGGTCAEAMRFYERALGGKIEMMMTAAESPMADQFPPESQNHVMHATLILGERRLMASDWMAPSPYPGMNGFGVSLNYSQVPEARRVFDALAEGGNVSMPFGKTFWAEGFGMLVDRFGTPWMVGGGGSVAG